MRGHELHPNARKVDPMEKLVTGPLARTQLRGKGVDPASRGIAKLDRPRARRLTLEADSALWAHALERRTDRPLPGANGCSILAELSQGVPQNAHPPRIAADPNICFGKPVMRSTRIWVSLILDLM